MKYSIHTMSLAFHLDHLAFPELFYSFHVSLSLAFQFMTPFSLTPQSYSALEVTKQPQKTQSKYGIGIEISW